MFKKMLGATKLTVAVTAMLGLSACAGFQLDNAKGLSPKGDAFSAGLYKEYLVLAEMEFAEGDYMDSDAFANRAIASANATRRLRKNSPLATFRPRPRANWPKPAAS